MSRALPLLLLFFLAACGHTETHAVMLRAPDARGPTPVELYLAEQPLPSQPFIEHGLVQAEGFGADANADDVTQALLDRASHLGCDAVVRTTIDLGYSRANAVGVCVRWAPGEPERPVDRNAPLLPQAPRNRTPPKARPAPLPKIEPLPSSPPGQ